MESLTFEYIVSDMESEIDWGLDAPDSIVHHGWRPLLLLRSIWGYRLVIRYVCRLAQFCAAHIESATLILGGINESGAMSCLWHHLIKKASARSLIGDCADAFLCCF